MIAVENKLSIGVIGVGVVGKATMDGFAQRGMKVSGWDKFRAEFNSMSDVLKANIIFVCVPTATNKETNEQDLNPLIETMVLLHTNKFKGAIVVKSTVIPGTTERLAAEHGLQDQVVHNPEFLTAAKPLQDFLSQKAILIGGPNPMARAVTQLCYNQAGFESVVLFESAMDTELAKYFHNLFLSVKVGFMNELAEVTKACGRNYTEILNGALMMGGIGRGHTAVGESSPEGKPGFGGMCFPKDTSAFLKFCQDLGYPKDILEATVQANQRRRPEIY